MLNFRYDASLRMAPDQKKSKRTKSFVEDNFVSTTKPQNVI